MTQQVSGASKDQKTAGSKASPPNAAPGKDLPPAAIRALEEAAARRAAKADQNGEAQPKELGGPGGEEPTRFGDWERKGRAVDF